MISNFVKYYVTMIPLKNRYATLENLEPNGLEQVTQDTNDKHTHTTYTHQTPLGRTNTAKTLSKQYFKLIQAMHHELVIENCIETETFPVGMTKQANKLTHFIKPSCPNVNTTRKIKHR